MKNKKWELFRTLIERDLTNIKLPIEIVVDIQNTNDLIMKSIKTALGKTVNLDRIIPIAEQLPTDISALIRHKGYLALS